MMAKNLSTPEKFIIHILRIATKRIHNIDMWARRMRWRLMIRRM
jgi:hypothetical protein